MPDTVPGFGPRNARIMIVGEAPAKQELIAGRPFVGRAGQELTKLCNSANIDRETCYITNASLKPVSGDKDDFFFEKGGRPTQTFLEGIVALGQDLQEIKPNVVIPMGNFALWALRQHQDIMRYRGSILRSEIFGCKVVPTIHPAAILHGGEDFKGMWKYRPIIILDLIRAREQAKFPELRLRKRELLVLEDLNTGEARDAIERLRHAQRLTYDIESFGGLDLACIGFSDGDPEWAACIPYHKDPSRLAIYKELLETDTPKIGQNLMYDATFMDQLGVHARNVIHDTMVAQHTLATDLPKGLDFMTSIYTDVPYYKDEGKEWKWRGGLRQFWEYNCKDICATTEVALEQERELSEDRELSRTFRRHMRLFEPLRWATYRGVRVDKDKFREFGKVAAEKAARYQAELDKAAGKRFNVNSPPQIKRLIYEERKLPPRYREKKLTTRANVLMDLAAKTKDRVPFLVVRTREQKKLLSNYFTEQVLSADGRIRSIYNIVGTKTGRRSSSRPPWGHGTNFQNQPEFSRAMIVADDGYEIGHFDGMQAEAIVTAYLANDPVHMDCFRNGKDVHRVTACLLLDKPPEDWKAIDKDSDIRQLAKKCNHGLNYDMGPVTFMYTVNAEWDPDVEGSLWLDEETATALWEKYRKIRPALQGYYLSVQAELRDNNMTLTTPIGNKRQFLDRWSDSLLKDAYSWKPQTIVGEVNSEAISRIYHDPELQKAGIQFLTETHDSHTWQWPKEARDAIVPRIMELCQVELYLNGYRVIIPTDGSVGTNWSKKDMDSLGRNREQVEIAA